MYSITWTLIIIRWKLGVPLACGVLTAVWFRTYNDKAKTVFISCDVDDVWISIRSKDFIHSEIEKCLESRQEIGNRIKFSLLLFNRHYRIQLTDLPVDAFGINIEDDEISQAGWYMGLWSLHQQRAINTWKMHQMGSIRIVVCWWRTADKHSAVIQYLGS